MINSLKTTWAPYLLSVLRIVTALLFISHGTQKLLGFPTPDFTPAMFTLPWFAGVLELFGGAAVLVGFYTRPVSFVLSGLMAFAYFMAHAPKSFFPAINGGDAAILFCFIFLYFTAAGAGPWSLDARKGRV